MDTSTPEHAPEFYDKGFIHRLHERLLKLETEFKDVFKEHPETVLPEPPTDHEPAQS